MNWALIAAIASPIVFGLGAVFDKYVLSRKVKDVYSYSPVSGMIILLFGFLIALFIPWVDLNFNDLIFPILAGVLFGGSYYLYFSIMKDSDASHVMGLLYFFPIVVVVLSLLFLGEKLTLVSSLSIIIILLGIFLLSYRAKKVKAGIAAIPIILFILAIGGFEFFVKVTTSNITPIQGLAIMDMAAGLSVLLGIFNRKVRRNFVSEMKNFRWALVSEFIALIATFFVFFAMSKLSATLVASVAAIQPLAVLLLEKGAHSAFGNMVQDVKLLPKLGAIVLIVLGVVLLTVFGTI